MKNTKQKILMSDDESINRELILFRPTYSLPMSWTRTLQGSKGCCNTLDGLNSHCTLFEAKLIRYWQGLQTFSLWGQCR